MFHEIPLFSLPPSTKPSLFELARVGDGMCSLIGDVRDLEQIESVVVPRGKWTAFREILTIAGFVVEVYIRVPDLASGNG